jgi:hypothetical protein
MYHFKDKIDYEGHFWFDKKLIENKSWALLPSASKAIFPVIASFSNRAGEAFPGEQTIAILSGNTDKVVRKGIKGLEGFPGIFIDSWVTRRGRRAKKYVISKPPEEKGSAFPFYKSVFEGGLWLHLKPSAQALYPVMRHFGFFDFDRYNEYGDFQASDFDEIYRDRIYDFCEATVDVLAEYSDITTRSVYNALQNLESQKLLSGHQDVVKKILIVPQSSYHRSYLNEVTKKKYKHLYKDEVD